MSAMEPAATPQDDLTVVVPVHNEEDAIGGVLASWSAELQRLGIDYRITVYDDGSTDGTPRILRELAGRNPRLSVLRHENRGHGPTVLRGYVEARTTWILQIDGDGEMDSSHFAALWQRRESSDFVVGARQDRVGARVRRLVSAGSRAAVRRLIGKGVRDVNSPYRLMRREALLPLLDLVPQRAFAPNVLLSGLAGRARLRVVEVPVPHRGRRSGRPSLRGRRLVVAVVRSFLDTLATARRARRRLRPVR
jgi:glycosyltransferase involved in cell wall biosynthesis